MTDDGTPIDWVRREHDLRQHVADLEEELSGYKNMDSAGYLDLSAGRRIADLEERLRAENATAWAEVKRLGTEVTILRARSEILWAQEEGGQSALRRAVEWCERRAEQHERQSKLMVPSLQRMVACYIEECNAIEGALRKGLR